MLKRAWTVCVCIRDPRTRAQCLSAGSSLSRPRRQRALSATVSSASGTAHGSSPMNSTTSSQDTLPAGAAIRSNAEPSGAGSQYAAICDAACQLITEHCAPSAKHLNIGMLARRLKKLNLWPIEGSTPKPILQNDPRLVMDATGGAVIITVGQAAISGHTAASSVHSSGLTSQPPHVRCTSVLPTGPATGLTATDQQHKHHPSAAFLANVQAALGYTFHDLQVLQCLLSPQSSGSDAEQALALLGDRVLELCVISTLRQVKPNLKPRQINSLMRQLVSNASLARLAHAAGLVPVPGRPLAHRAVGTYVEALFGAIHSDCCTAGRSSDAAQQCILALLEKHMCGEACSLAEVAETA